jgi:hypothetical protein
MAASGSWAIKRNWQGNHIVSVGAAGRWVRRRRPLVALIDAAAAPAAPFRSHGYPGRWRAQGAAVRRRRPLAALIADTASYC